MENRNERTKSLRAKKVLKEKKEKRVKGLKEKLDPVQFQIKRVHIEGLQRTASNEILPMLKPLFKAETYGEVTSVVKKVHREIKQSGCFESVDVFVDTIKSEDVEEKSHLEVTFRVKERDRLDYGVNVRFLDGSKVAGCFSGKLPNITGHRDTLKVSLTRSLLSKDNVESLRLIRSRFSSWIGDLTLLLELNRRRHSLDWRCLDSQEYCGSLTGLIQPLWWLQYKVKTDCAFRGLSAQGSKSSFNARYECGYSMKSSIGHELTLDTRDNLALPTKGFVLNVLQEFAGGPFGGNIHFAKNVLYTCAILPIFKKSSLSASLRAETIGSLSQESAIKLTSSDMMEFVNSHLIPRGLGPKSLSDFALQDRSQTLLTASFKFMSPLPLLRSSNWIQKICRWHLFSDITSLNVGQCEAPAANLKSFVVGAGLVAQLGRSTRLELNVCQPIRKWSVYGNPSLTLGLGLTFL